jgi:hypothetical protein
MEFFNGSVGFEPGRYASRHALVLQRHDATPYHFCVRMRTATGIHVTPMRLRCANGKLCISSSGCIVAASVAQHHVDEWLAAQRACVRNERAAPG